MAKKEIIEKINNRLIEILESGVNPWRKPWRLLEYFTPSKFAYNYKTKKPYAGINQIVLPAGAYLTFNQIKEMGLKLNKGSKGLSVVRYNKAIIKANKQELKVFEEEFALLKDGEFMFIGNTIYFKKDSVIYKEYRILKNFTVFNVADCGIVVEDEKDSKKEFNRYETADNVIKDYVSRSKLNFSEINTDEACYIPYLHKVVVPKIDEFDSVSEYYQTIFHELSHSTGHKSLLNRGEITKDDFEETIINRYSKEELIAEISSSYCMGDLDITDEKTSKNSASYLAFWATKLKTDKTLSEKIISLSSAGEKAYNLIFDYGKAKELD